MLKDRGAYVAAALTIARAYISAGCPGTLPPLASFEDWSRIVRSALVWLGCAGTPSKPWRRRAPTIPRLPSLRSLCHAWHDAVGTSERTTGQVKALASEDYMGSRRYADLQQALFEVAEGRGGEIDARRLGQWLGRYKGRVVDELKLGCREDGHSKQKLWSVVRV